MLKAAEGTKSYVENGRGQDGTIMDTKKPF